MSRKVLACLGGVARNRFAQPLQIVEFRLVAQLAQEAHAQPPPVELAVPVEEMYFEKRLRHRIDRRAPSYARHAAAEVFNLHDVDAGERRPLRERNVRRRKAELAAEPRPASHLAADRVRPAEQPLGTREIARRQRRSYRRARDALTVERNIRHRFEREAVAAGSSFERGEVALALGAKAEVASDQQPRHTEPTHQYIFNEMRRAHRRKARVEANEMHALHLRRGEELELVV